MFWNNQVNDLTGEDRTGNIEFAEGGCTFFSIECITCSRHKNNYIVTLHMLDSRKILLSRAFHDFDHF